MFNDYNLLRMVVVIILVCVVGGGYILYKLVSLWFG